MEIQLEKVHFSKSEEYDKGYEVVFENENIKKEIDVCNDSLEHKFLQRNVGNEIYIGIVDDRVMGLMSLDTSEFEMLTNFTFARCTTRLNDYNLDYLKEKYGVDQETFEEEFLSSYKNKMIEVKKGTIKEVKDKITKAKVTFTIEGKEESLWVLNGTEEACLLIAMSDNEKSWTNIGKKIIGKELYIATAGGKVIQLIDPKTKKSTFVEYEITDDGNYFSLETIEEFLNRKFYMKKEEFKVCVNGQMDKKLEYK